MSSNPQVAKEILSQLGGRQFLSMTGSKNLVYSDNTLTMKLVPNKSKAKYLIITLNSMDTYDMKFVTVNRSTGEQTIKKQFNGIYDDGLVQAFESTTGLYTKLF